MTSIIQIKKKSKDVFELPDGSITYTMKKAVSEYKKIKSVKYTTSDLILFLLISQEKPIRSKTVFFKEMFYFEKEIFKGENLENCKFVPYHYGPYSFYVANKLNYLVRKNLIHRSKEEGTGKIVFEITYRGKRAISKKYVNLSNPVKKRMITCRMGLDQLGMKILNLIYRDKKYEKYIVKSRISHRYKLISWGKIDIDT